MGGYEVELPVQSVCGQCVVFRSCFDNFDYDRIAAYGEDDIARIMNTEGMIRSRRKIETIITNARHFQEIRYECGSFSAYLWAFSGGASILYNKHADGWIPASNGLSARVSGDLKRRGFKFLGDVTIYSHLQACGIINDHSNGCPCYARLVAQFPTVRKRRDKEKNVCFYGDSATE